MLEDRDLRQIRDIVSREIYDALREQLPKVMREYMTERDLRRELSHIEERIIKQLS